MSPHPGSQTGLPWLEMPVSQNFQLCVFLITPINVFLIDKSQLSLKFSGKRPSAPFSTKQTPMEKDARFQSLPFYNIQASR